MSANSPDVQYVFDTIDIACPQMVGDPHFYPVQTSAWLDRGIGANGQPVTKEEIAADMTATLQCIPPNPPNQPDGGCHQKRYLAFAQEFNASTLWDGYYNRINNGNPTLAKPDCAKIQAYVFGTPTEPPVEPPHPPNQSIFYVTVATAGKYKITVEGPV